MCCRFALTLKSASNVARGVGLRAFGPCMRVPRGRTICCAGTAGCHPRRTDRQRVVAAAARQ